MNENNKGINFKYCTIENGRSFEKTNIPLSNQGIVLIQGDNGVGKSSLWDIFEAVLYGSTPDEHKKDELTKNENDATYAVCFEKNGETFNISLKRKKGKWAYEIQKDNTIITDHTYNDAVKSIPKLIGLTKSEFEGSVHLTQSSQHILIKSELSERKKYISNFFNIDDRYDQVQLAAKQESEKISEQITNLSGLSHSKQMLEAELQKLIITDIEEFRNKLNTLQKHYDKLLTKLDKTDKIISIWGEYNKYISTASFVDHPEDLIKEIEKNIVENKGKLNYIEETNQRNEQALKINRAIDELESNQKKILVRFPELETDTISIVEYSKELQQLQTIKNQNETVQNLRKELKTLPKVEELPIQQIEDQLLELQVSYQTHAQHKIAKEKGICTQCGSKFDIQDVQKEVEILVELRENINLLNEDYSTIKDRNTKVKRRKLIESHLEKIPLFSKENEKRISFLEDYIKYKKEYSEIFSGLKILSRMEITEGVNAEDIPLIKNKIQEDLNTIEGLKNCVIAQKLLPAKPKDSEESLIEIKTVLHNEIISIKNAIQNINQTMGECKNINDTHKRLTHQLDEINKKLDGLEDLKKEEFFWNKLTDAYGPKGLRIQQLEKMMDLIIQQLPVYCSILFKEKKLTFKHKVDPNNVKILACREEADEKTNEINRFQHDISSFSGGEKDLMSVSFILTLADCVPHHKKANILILDEVDAQLDADGKYRYTNQLLPMLKKKHDTIFVISHNKEVQLANIYDQVWQIEKHNHKSTIKVTHVNQYN